MIPILFGTKEHPAQLYITKTDRGQYNLTAVISTGDSRLLGSSTKLSVTLDGFFRLLEKHPEFTQPILH